MYAVRSGRKAAKRKWRLTLVEKTHVRGVTGLLYETVEDYLGTPVPPDALSNQKFIFEGHYLSNKSVNSQKELGEK